jgi:uncharacterized membrane protein
MAPILHDWLTVLLRWGHIVAAIMWIGDSLLFMWIDSHLFPDPQARQDVTGVTWLLHGGGYYELEKRLLVPGRVPPRLRWFWAEATGTWISGLLLLALIYYVNANAFMIDGTVAHLTPGQAVAVGLGILAGGWLLYDSLWRSPLGRRAVSAVVLSLVLLSGVNYAATHLLSARAAFLHVGAMLGTIMAANVWVHILPPQRTMVRAALHGREVDYSLGAHAKIRSTHNTYLTFPVIFLMISQHFPEAYVGPMSWLVLSLIVVVGAGLRHVMLVGFPASRWTAAATASAAIALVYLTLRPALIPSPPSPSVGSTAAVPPFIQVRTIIVQRCAVCHSDAPTMPGVASAPNGVRMDTPEQIRTLAGLIKARAVDERAMPPGNVTGITENERATLKRWVEAGAPIR